MHMSLSSFRHLLIVALALIALSGCSTMGPTMKASPSLMNAMGVASYPLKDLERKYTTRESRWLEIDGLRIHYRDVGEGHPVVLVHGIMSSLHTWDGWTAELRRNYRVISLDVPSYGLTGALPDHLEYSDETLLSLFSQFVDELELERFSIAGNSLGGYLAALYAAQNPQRVERLILLDPIGYPQETPWVFDMATLPGISTLGRFIAPPFLVTMNVRDVYGDSTRLTQENLARYIHMSQRPGAKSAYMTTMVELKKRSSREVPLPFYRIKAPTLLMWGEADRWVPVELAERWKADIPHLQLITYPGVGHVPMEELPYETAQDAKAFLADLAVTPSSRSTSPSGAGDSLGNLERLLQGESELAPQSELGEMAPLEL